MIEQKALISIIVPVYNVEKYLHRCVDSLRNQTYTSLEIILVDDGSTDSCPKICDEFAKLDDRIEVIHKENGGLSDARNVAIDICKGKYLLFVDSDDFIAHNTVELLYETLTKNKCDISTCGYINHYETVSPLGVEGNTELILDTEEALENMLYQKDVTTSAWGKLYKRELFDGIRYPKGKICEDLPTTYKLFSRSTRIVINTSIKFYYQQRTDSIINSQFKRGRMDALDFAEEQLKYMEKNHPSLARAARNRYVMEAIFIITQIPRDDRRFTREIQRCVDVIKNYRREVVFDGNSKHIYRLYSLISFLGCANLAGVYKIKSRLKNYIERKAL